AREVDPAAELTRVRLDLHEAVEDVDVGERMSEVDDDRGRDAFVGIEAEEGRARARGDLDVDARIDEARGVVAGRGRLPRDPALLSLARGLLEVEAVGEDERGRAVVDDARPLEPREAEGVDEVVAVEIAREEIEPGGATSHAGVRPRSDHAVGHLRPREARSVTEATPARADEGVDVLRVGRLGDETHRLVRGGGST